MALGLKGRHARACLPACLPGCLTDRLTTIYLPQVRIALQAQLVKDPEERERRRTEWWDAVHERNR